MLSKKIKYTDFRGEEQEKEFLFNLSQQELTDMELGGDGLSGYLQRIMDSGDNRKILDALKMIISKAYGVLSDDGRAFLKPSAAWEYFEGCGAYEQLYLSFFGPGGSTIAAEFVNGIVPADLAAKAREAEAQNGFRPGASTDRPIPPGMRAPVQTTEVHPEPAPAPEPQQVQEPVVESYAPVSAVPQQEQPSVLPAGYEQAQARMDAQAETDQPQMQVRENPPEAGGSTIAMSPAQADSYDKTKPLNHPTLMPTTYDANLPQNPAV